MTVWSVLIIVFLVASSILLPIIIERVFSSDGIKLWQKGLLNTAITGLVLAFACIFSSFPRSTNRDQKVARQYLDDIGINVEFPYFTVERHTFRHLGGDDTEEWWVIEFAQPLSESFVAQIDSLCRVDGSKWSRVTQGESNAYSGDAFPCYVFSYWDPELIEIKETVTIFPRRRIAWLTHLKI